MPVTLPPKENNLFKRILKCYEQKQYKIGLKFAKQILTNPKYAEHGETLAMKGLILNCLGRKDEAYDYVRKGLRNDLKSHVCWHVYGLLQRSDKKYDEAIKCYRNALKWDKDNIQILRDLSLLQIQMRDLDGYKDTRYRLLQLRAGQRASWIGYAMSYHLLKDFDMANTLLEEYRKTQLVSKPDAEHSELLLYQNMVLREAGRLEDSLNHLNTYESVICDKLAVKEIKASLFIQLGNYSGAETLYRELLKRNPENWGYYTGLEQATRAETPEDRLLIYKEFIEIFPRSLAPKRLPLNFTSGETFTNLLEDYIKPALRKGVPPLFVNLRTLYKCKEKAKIIEDTILKYLKNLQEKCSLTGEGEEKDPPTVLLWTYYFLAQHYDHLRQSDKAMEYINIAIEHTPTLIESYMVKARICKHAGDHQNAAYWMDEARMLDTADRYVNSKCAKYQLRANQVDKAEETCALFTRDGVPSAENLNEMQCMWYQTECGLAFQRLGNVAEALKKGHEIEKHFEEITEDQFDFHTYCMRKMTLTAYVRLLRLEDILRSHKFYLKAARLCIECYMQLHDNPLTDQDTETDSQIQNMTAKELKKLRSKQRRAEKKAQIQQQDKLKNDTKDSKEADKKSNDSNKEGSIDAESLVRVEDPIDQALKFLMPLQVLLPKNIETHLLAFEIYIRKEKMLLMLQALKRAYAIEPNNPTLHECIIRFMKKVNELDNDKRSVVLQVIRREMKSVLGDKDACQYNEFILNSNSKSMQHMIAGGKMMYLLDPSKVQEALAITTDLSDDLVDRTLENSTKVLNTIIEGFFGECEAEAQSYADKCHKIFPLSVLFTKQENPKVNGTTENEGTDSMCDGEEA